MVEARDKRRAFTITQKNNILYQQDNKCAICHRKLDIRIVEYDHIKAWSAEGKTIVKNGAALCPNCHRKKTFSQRLKAVDKPKTENPLATRKQLNEITLAQLKLLARKHNITVSGSVYESIMWGSKRVAPTKRFPN